MVDALYRRPRSGASGYRARDRLEPRAWEKRLTVGVELLVGVLVVGFCVAAVFAALFSWAIQQAQ